MALIEQLREGSIIALMLLFSHKKIIGSFDGNGVLYINIDLI